MLEDTFEGMEDGEEMEEEAEEEIDKILFELTAGEVISLTLLPLLLSTSQPFKSKSKWNYSKLTCPQVSC